MNHPSSSSNEPAKPRRRFMGALRRFRHSTIDRSALELPDTTTTKNSVPKTVPRRKAPRSKSVLVGSKEQPWRQSLTERRRQKSLVMSHDRDMNDATTITDGTSISESNPSAHSHLLDDDKTQKFDSWLANVLDNPSSNCSSTMDDSVSTTTSGRSQTSSSDAKHSGVARASTILFEQQSRTASGRGTRDFLDNFLAKGFHVDGAQSQDPHWDTSRKKTKAEPMELDFSCIEYSKTRPDSAEFVLPSTKERKDVSVQSADPKNEAANHHHRMPVYSSAAIAQAKRNQEIEAYIAEYEHDPYHSKKTPALQHKRHDGHHGRPISKRPSMLTSSLTQADL